MAKAKFKRVLLKLSGEALMGDEEYGISTKVLTYLAQEIKEITKLGVQVGMVIGAGNIFRGVSGASGGMDRAAADNMGMLATVLNSLALKDALDNHGVSTAVLSAIPMTTVCEPYSRLLAMDHFQRGNAVIFAAGTGNPYFTTDPAGVLRGLEINADLICKATRVDGVYDKDPLKYSDAVKFKQLTFSDVLHRRLKVMDAAAISLAMDNNQKILVFDLGIPGNIKKAALGQNVGTLITGEDE
ncbi:MAG: UMP kinase [Deltaproteobacteria bacterium]|jgi:uridylate kinase|nr:UMP kinase [Deltaproteobacteria bacterium]